MTHVDHAPVPSSAPLAARVPELVLCELPAPTTSSIESWSPFCLKVHRALRAARLPYERRHGAMPSSFKSLNPAAKVPVLLIDGEAVADSTAILRRLDAISGGALVPRDPELAARAWLVEDHADTALNGFLVAARWADDRNWAGVRDAYFGGAPWLVQRLVAPRIRARVLQTLGARDVTLHGLERTWDDLGRALDHLDATAPRDGFLFGALSVADVGVFAQVHALRVGLTEPQRAMVEARGRLTAWLDRIDAATRG